MNEIICPHCNKAFQVDKKGYADILKQVYDKEFENKLNERLLQIEKDKTMEIHLEKKEAERKIISAKGERDAQIIISEGLTENVLKNKAIEVFKELSASNNSKIIITNGETPLMISNDADKK